MANRVSNSATSRILSLAALALVLLGPGPAAHGAPFTNGGFEEGPSVQRWRQLPAGTSLLQGWRVIGDVDYIGTTWTADEGSRSLDLSHLAPGGIEQTFDTLPGHTYRVTFAAAGNPDETGPKTLRVSAADQAGLFRFESPFASREDPRWVERSFLFVAEQSQTTLRFTAQAPGNAYGPSLDDVRVEWVSSQPSEPREDFIEVIGDNRTEFRWEPAPGPVALYSVWISENDGPYRTSCALQLSEPRLALRGRPGSSYRIRISAHDGAGRPGPLSEASNRLDFVAGDGQGLSADPAPSGGCGQDRWDLRDHALDPWLAEFLADSDHRAIAFGSFDGHPAVDLLYRDRTDSAVGLALSGGSQVAIGIVPAPWSVIGIADWSSDGVDDVLWSNTETGEAVFWAIRNGGLGGVRPLQLSDWGPNWLLDDTWDVDRDGSLDLVWRDPSERRVAIQFLTAMQSRGVWETSQEEWASLLQRWPSP